MDNVAIIANMVREAEKHADDMSKDRIRAVEYYQGVMHDTPADKGRSQMVSRDVRATIKKVLPSLMRTILGSDQVVEYQPMGEGDEEGASQASDYMNFVVLEECDGYRAVEDAIHDALLLRNGILKWWFEEKRTAKVTTHTGLPDDAFAELVASPDVEVLEHSERQDVTELGPVVLHDAKIRRIVTQRNIRAGAVPRERFLIHPEAVTLAESPLVGEVLPMRRSDLVAMGYDRELIFSLPIATDDEDESDVRRDFVDDADESSRANEQVDYYDIYVRVDMDGDGIAELHHMCFAGGLTEKHLLMDEEADEVQFCDIKVMSQPHQWEGISVFDDVADIQRGKTVLLRQTLDNLYWQNNPQQIMQRGAVLNPEAVFQPEFGLPIEVERGVDIRAALGFNPVPFVAEKSFGMMEYLDREAQERTGISDASSGLAPDSLQNMTAKASAMIEQAGIGQAELMVRTAAEGLTRFFKGLLKLVVKHQDVPRTVRLRGKWVQFDPRSWNSDMDCRVNTGLGAGTRERDMMMMQLVMGAQEKLLANLGAENNPFVTPENLHNSLEKFVEAAGLKTPSLYFTKPDPQQIAALMQRKAQQPSPEMAKVQAQAQVEQAKLQLQGQMKAAEMQQQAQADRERIAAETELKREQMKAELQLSRERMLAEVQLKRESMALQSQFNMTPANVGGDVQFGGAVG